MPFAFATGIVNLFSNGVLGEQIEKINKVREESKQQTITSEKFNEEIKNINDFEYVIEIMSKLFEASKKPKIIIFDEMDRCQDENIFKILTAIKLLILKMKSRNYFLICAINKEHIDENISRNSESYMDKIFDKEINLEGLIEFDEKIFSSIQNEPFIYFIKQKKLKILENWKKLVILIMKTN